MQTISSPEPALATLGSGYPWAILSQPISDTVRSSGTADEEHVAIAYPESMLDLGDAERLRAVTPCGPLVDALC